MVEMALFLCNGKKEDCKKTRCYKNIDDDPCRYTSDIRYAVNFEEYKGIFIENVGITDEKGA